jgi:hypothetical protein
MFVNGDRVRAQNGAIGKIFRVVPQAAIPLTTGPPIPALY